MSKNVIIQDGALREDKSNKIRFDLIPISMLKRLAQRYTDGAAAHGYRNREGGGIEFAKGCKSSAYRHFISWVNNEIDEDHMSACVFNMFAYEFLMDKNAKIILEDKNKK